MNVMSRNGLGNNDYLNRIYIRASFACVLSTPLELIMCQHIARSGNPITGLNRPRAFQEVEVPRFQDMKVARLSALRTGRFLPPGNIPGTHFC